MLLLGGGSPPFSLHISTLCAEKVKEEDGKQNLFLDGCRGGYCSCVSNFDTNVGSGLVKLGLCFEAPDSDPRAFSVPAFNGEYFSLTGGASLFNLLPPNLFLVVVQQRPPP